MQAVKRFREEEGWTVSHVRVPSKAPRTPHDPLWTASLLDLVVRHGSSNHERETIAYSKRAQGALLRMAVFQVNRNFIRGVRAQDGKRSPSPAMKRGLMDRRHSVEEVLVKRLFPSRVELPEDLQEVRRERIPTRQVEKPQSHHSDYTA